MTMSIEARKARVDALLFSNDRLKLGQAIANIAHVAEQIRQGNTATELLARSLDWAGRDTQEVLDRLSEGEDAS